MNLNLMQHLEANQLKCKVLFLGAGEVGKATICKQIRYIYGRAFEETERIAVKPHLTQNVIEAMRTLAVHSDVLAEQGIADTRIEEHEVALREIRDRVARMSDKQNADTRIEEHEVALREIRDRVARMSDKQKFTAQHYHDFIALWSDARIRKTAEYRHQFQLVASYKHLFAKMHNYWRDDYVPTVEDIMVSRQRTTGVNKTSFSMRPTCKHRGRYAARPRLQQHAHSYSQHAPPPRVHHHAAALPRHSQSHSNHEHTYRRQQHVMRRSSECEYLYEIFLTGGQKNERRKWQHFFPNTHLCIDVINLSGFCELLWEDNRKNRLREDIGLFRTIINLPVLEHCHWIVIMNKYDMFVQHIHEGQKFSEFFKDYKGSNLNSKQIIDYIVAKLLDQIREKTYLAKQRQNIRFFVTNALNTQCVKHMFDYIHQHITEELIFKR
eukprot:CAMPEP_0197077024 /NCGR_PEP_ID=MMETSP1384-20130603/212409_1 /TAXON_ID=29189 /ORGANISM="Ammonia sp." /LENGTH=437 /DNA_ID=CAMNT_0042515883 /DNA_START=389 /DNA_END=1703 /DNA_ORIENTATION=-